MNDAASTSPYPPSDPQHSATLPTSDNATPCEHDWMQRGTEGDLWRECFLCGLVCEGCKADAQNDWFGPPHACEEDW